MAWDSRLGCPSAGKMPARTLDVIKILIPKRMPTRLAVGLQSPTGLKSVTF